MVKTKDEVLKMDKIKIGVFGLGRGGDFISAFKLMDDVEITAVCEMYDETLEKKREKLPKETLIFKDFDAFIKCGIEAVVLVDKFHEHAKYAIKALENGVHVLSETTAAATLGECVQLCEAVEKSGCKYMLATNTPYFSGNAELDRLYKSNSFGRVLYAEGEYCHPGDPRTPDLYKTGDHHWRRYLPVTYYNMHDLGTLMRITETMPKKVNAKASFAPDVYDNLKLHRADVMAAILTEMDNGAIFRTTACAGIGPIGKWFRLSCTNGAIETIRGDETSVRYAYNEWCVPEDGKMEDSYKAPAHEIPEEQQKAGHGGEDYFLDRDFIRYLKGEYTPFFDVYRSVALSATAILAWRSVLNNGNGYDIPDFTDKEARKAVANDFLTPFTDNEGNGATLPCSSKPYTPKWI